MISKGLLQYMVGGLLYMPAFQTNIVDKIKSQSIKCLTSIALCLEDSIRDEAVKEAEKSLMEILQELKALSDSEVKLPLIFIRIRSPKHLQKIHEKISPLKSIITGYILPKFDLSNSENYAAIIYEINRNKTEPLYIMPILETEMIADLTTRNEALIKIKRILDIIKDSVLNIRVGVNDLSNLYSLRRGINQTVYDMGVIRDILINVLSVFAKDYVVAGPVYNFFEDDNSSLKRELALDKLNGFIGKTAIHPAQLPIIYESLKVSRADYEDAEQILNWQSNSHGVIKGQNRMNELKCHTKWAQRIKILSEIYGIG